MLWSVGSELGDEKCTRALPLLAELEAACSLGMLASMFEPTLGARMLAVLLILEVETLSFASVAWVASHVMVAFLSRRK